jgi:sulfur carrier protein ThiS
LGRAPCSGQHHTLWYNGLEIVIAGANELEIVIAGAIAMVHVVPVGMLRQYVGGQEAMTLEGWAGRPVRALIESLGIPSALVGAVLIHGTLVTKDHLLQAGEEVKLIPLVGGG